MPPMSPPTLPACGYFPAAAPVTSRSPRALLQQFRPLGVPATQLCTAAFRQLILRAPAPVVVYALGYGLGTATRYVIAVGGTWNGTQPPAPRTEYDAARSASAPVRDLLWLLPVSRSRSRRPAPREARPPRQLAPHGISQYQAVQVPSARKDAKLKTWILCMRACAQTRMTDG
jgi:hypothetical protein